MIFTLKNGNKINIPFYPRSIPFGKYSDFKFIEQKFLKSSQSFPEGVDPESLTPEQFDKFVIYENDPVKGIEHVTEVVNLICGDFSGVEFRDSTEKETDFIDINKFAETNITVQRVYFHILNVINSYIPKKISKDYIINLNGVEYILYWDKDMASKSLTNGEVLSVLEFNKQAEAKKDDKGITDGTVGYNLGLETTAILLRKHGEELPANRRERISFINQRKKLFELLPMDIVLDIVFFLRDTTELSVKTQLINTFSKAKNPKKPKRKKKLKFNTKQRQSGKKRSQP